MKGDGAYSRRETLKRLSWLARRLKEHQHTIFLLEELQPSWLANNFQRAVYLVVLCLILGVVSGFVGLVASVSLEPAFELEFPHESARWLLVQTPAWLLCMGLLDLCLPRHGELTGRRGEWPTAARVILGWLLWMLLPTCLQLFEEDYEIASAVQGVFVAALFAALSYRRRALTDIPTVEALRFSWPHATRAFGLATLTGLVLYLVYLLLWLVKPDRPSLREVWAHELYCLFGYSLMGGVVGLLLGGFIPRIASGKTIPNQGIRMSIRNALTTAAWSGPVISASAAGFLLGSQPFRVKDVGYEEITTHTALDAGLGVALLSSYCAGLWFGGLSALKHGVLRVVLRVTGQTPRNFVAFLEHAVQLEFLQRVGGGYMFLHRTLLEHFAELTDADIKSLDVAD